MDKSADNSNSTIQSVKNPKTSEKTLSERINFYVINLDRAVDRMERIEKDFASFPIPFIRVLAVDGKTLTIPIDGYDAMVYSLNVGREASPGEIGCYLSHLKVLKMFLESDKEFALICEDDAMPTPDSYAVLKQAIAHAETWDLLRLYTSRRDRSFPYRSLPLPHNATVQYSLYTQLGCMFPAAAYVVNRQAAGILVRKLVPMPDPYDLALFQGRVGVREANVFPNCFLLSEHCGNSTISNRTRRKDKLWHVVYWTRRVYRLRVQIVRYSLQIFRMIRRRLG